MDAPVAAMVDVSFALAGEALPRDHGQLLAQALARRLPWLDADDAVGVHRIRVVAGQADPALLSRRSRLALRVQRGRAGELVALAGTPLDIGGHRVRLGDTAVRELLSYGTLYAPMVIAADADELQFLASVQSELDALCVRARAICGRRSALRHCDAQLEGFSLMLDGLSASDSLRVQQHGIGPHRRLGCGLFMPHRSATAVQA